MIKTELFEEYLNSDYEGISIDTQINMFIQANPDIEVIDIKLTSTNVDEELKHAALLIYKEVE